MAKKALVLAPNHRIAIEVGRIAGYSPMQVIWLDEREKVMGHTGPWFEAVSDRPFNAFEENKEWAKHYEDILREARLRFRRHASTWTQVYLA